MSGIVRVVRPKPSGVITITENNVQIDVSKFATADIAVPVEEGVAEATTDAEMQTFVDESEGGEIVKFTGTSSTYENGRLYIVKGEKKEISFTIAGTAYQAEDSMTWAEWCDSEYNINDLYTYTVSLGGMDFGAVAQSFAAGGHYSNAVIDESQSFVQPDEEIIENYSYLLKISGGGGSD